MMTVTQRRRTQRRTKRQARLAQLVPVDEGQLARLDALIERLIEVRVC